MKIVFMGTPDFAIPSLKLLLQSQHRVVAVVTATDKPAGRGKRLRASPVKLFAQEAGLPVLQPEKLKNPDFLQQLSAFRADLFVVVAFRILPAVVFEMPAGGTINLHASLLPKYRGAAPINWALIKGETETGVTTFFIEEKVDTGQILLQRKVSIPEDMTAGELHDLLSHIGAEVLLETVNGIEAGTLKAVPQVGEVTPAPKLTKELGLIDWSQSARTIHNLVRGLSPIPGSYTFFNGKMIKIIKSKVSDEKQSGGLAPGTVVQAGKNGPLDVQTGQGVLSLLEIQPANKRVMTTAEFIRGYRIEPGDRFGS